MIWALLGLLAGFMLVLIFLFYLLLKTPLGVGYKLLAVLVVTGFYWIQYEALQQYTGWPSNDDLPEQFVLVATEVQEPNKQTGQPGIMYWWVRDSSEPDLPPRVYQLPYQSDIHEKTEQVIEEQKKGGLYIGRNEQQSAANGGLGISFEKFSKASHYQKK